MYLVKDENMSSSNQVLSIKIFRKNQNVVLAKGIHDMWQEWSSKDRIIDHINPICGINVCGLIASYVIEQKAGIHQYLSCILRSGPKCISLRMDQLQQ